MKKGLEFELDVRTVSEVIFAKIGYKRSGKISISDEEFYDFDSSLPARPTYKLRSNADLATILLQIEKNQKGKIKLINTVPKTRLYKRYGEELLLNDYALSFDLDFAPKVNVYDKKTILFLSTKGFGRIYTGTNKDSGEFVFRKNDKKLKFLLTLIEAKKKSVPTSELSKVVGIKNTKDFTKFVSQLRRGIKKLPGIIANSVLPLGIPTEGYKLGDNVEIKIER